MITKKQFIRTLAIILSVNVVVILGLVIFVNSSLKKTVAAEGNVRTDIFEEVPEDVSVVNVPDISSESSAADEKSRDDLLQDLKYNTDNDNAMSTIYKNLLPGTYVLEDGKMFEFTEAGVFNGYFDENEPSVSGYTYIVGMDDYNDNILTIKDRTGKGSVIYYISMTSGGKFELMLPDTDVSYILDES